MPTRIEDFGEHIGGAKKELWSSRGLQTSDLADMNNMEANKYVTKDNVWPKIDYKARYAAGDDRRVLFCTKLIKDSLPRTPDFPADSSGDWKQTCREAYISEISNIRDKLSACRTYEDVAAFAERYSRIAGSMDTTTTKLRKALYVCKDENRVNAAIKKKEFLYSDEERLMKDFKFFKYDPGVMQIGTDPYNLLPYMACKQGSSTTYIYFDKNTVSDDLQKQFVPDKWFCVKGNGLFREYMNFDSRAEVYNAVLKNEKEKSGKTVVAAAESKKRKTVLKPPQLKNIERVAPDKILGGRHATGEMYMDTFGFRGGEFGNWMSDKDRQASMDMGYEALKDMSKALNISDKDISMGGTLAIAFGARGSGNAAAHYEPERNVINLTKLNGAGSLGHELCHALDMYCGKALGYDTYLTAACRDNKNAKNLPDSFVKLMSTLKEKTLTGQEAADHIKHEAEQLASNFSKDLHAISRPHSDPVLEAKRESLINAVIEEIKDPDFKPGNPYQGTPTSAYKTFMDFQKEHGDSNPACLQNRCWCTGRQFTIANKFRNATQPDNNIKTTVPTRFYEDAQVLDSNFSRSGHGYWTSDEELFARAGAAYIKDRCAGQNIRNDYLSCHADQFVTIDGKTISTAPLGDDRRNINTAFDAFIEELKTLEIFYEHEPEEAVPEQPTNLQSRENPVQGDDITYTQMNFSDYFASMEDMGR